MVKLEKMKVFIILSVLALCLSYCPTCHHRNSGVCVCDVGGSVNSEVVKPIKFLEKRVRIMPPIIYDPTPLPIDPYIQPDQNAIAMIQKDDAQVVKSISTGRSVVTSGTSTRTLGRSATLLRLGMIQMKEALNSQNRPLASDEVEIDSGRAAAQDDSFRGDSDFDGQLDSGDGDRDITYTPATPDDLEDY